MSTNNLRRYNGAETSTTSLTQHVKETASQEALYNFQPPKVLEMLPQEIQRERDTSTASLIQHVKETASQEALYQLSTPKSSRNAASGDTAGARHIYRFTHTACERDSEPGSTYNSKTVLEMLNQTMPIKIII